jgi:septal ring factor EnvC (AmiA/AmiB activator)
MTALIQELDGLKRELKKDKEGLAGDKQSFEEVSKELQQQRNEKNQQTARLDRMEALKRFDTSNYRGTPVTTKAARVNFGIVGKAKRRRKS